MRIRRLIVSLICLAWPISGLAQTPEPAKNRRWSLDIYGGAGSMSTSSSGSPVVALPGGETFITEAGTPSRFQATWRLGDGAALFNDVVSQFSATLGRTLPTIYPLDDVLRSPGRRANGTTIGARLSRQFGTHWAASLIVERQRAGLSIDPAFDDVLERHRASFDEAFTAFFETAPANNISVTSTLTRTGDSSTHTRVLLQIERTLWQRNQWSIQAGAGGGVELAGSTPSEVVLQGRYVLQPFGQSQLAESDDVRISYDEGGTAAAGIASLAVQRLLSASTAVRLDARMIVAGSRSRVQVRLSPLSSPGNALPLSTATTPGLQFSNQSIPRSTLDGSAGTTMTTFDGSGTTRQLQVTLGLRIRF